MHDNSELTFGQPLMVFNMTIIPVVRVSRIVFRNGGGAVATPVAIFILEGTACLFAPLLDNIEAEDVINELNSSRQ